MDGLLPVVIDLTLVNMPFCLCVFGIEWCVCAKCKFKCVHLSLLPLSSDATHHRHSYRQVPSMSFLRGKAIKGLHYILTSNKYFFFLSLSDRKEP